MSTVLAVVAGLAETIRETLPRTEEEAGPFVAGLCWAMVLFWGTLIAVTWLHCAAKGGGC
jgi:hypothetical protein